MSLPCKSRSFSPATPAFSLTYSPARDAVAAILRPYSRAVSSSSDICISLPQMIDVFPEFCPFSLAAAILLLLVYNQTQYEKRSRRVRAQSRPVGEVSTGSGPGSLRGQSAWGGGCDRVTTLAISI